MKRCRLEKENVPVKEDMVMPRHPEDVNCNRLYTEMSNQGVKTPSIADFPDLVLLTIFSFLNPFERFKVGRVCSRWYDLSRASILWKHLDMKNMHSYQLQKLLLSLPSTVTHLNLSCKDSIRHTELRVTEVFGNLSKRCPSLKNLTLENVHFNIALPHCHKCKTPREWHSRCNECGYKVKDSYQDFHRKKNNSVECIFMPQLLVLSLPDSCFRLKDFFSQMGASHLPKVEVINFSGSFFYNQKHIVSLSRLNSLQELYLGGTRIKDELIISLLQIAKGLKVLDLEWPGSVEELFPALRKYGQSLEKLYLGKRRILDADLTELLFKGGNSFPHLGEICVRQTELTDIGIQQFLSSCHSLKCLDVSQCSVSREWLQCHGWKAGVNGKIIFEENVFPQNFCNHFKKNNSPVQYK